MRKGIWFRYNSLEKLKQKYLQECLEPTKNYGKFLKHLEQIIPQFQTTRTVYLTDLVKCPNRENKNPTKSMIDKCHSTHWEDLIQTLDPKYIIGLGKMPTKVIAGFDRIGNDIQSVKILVRKKEYWFISAPHPSYKSISNISCMAFQIKAVLSNPRKYAIKKISRSSRSDVEKRRIEIQKQLIRLGYQPKSQKFRKGNRVVNIAVSKKYGSRTRIYWKEHWKNDYATVFDYKLVDGPTCIVPIEALFSTDYVKQKRRDYGKSKNWWTGTYPRDHELTELIMKYQNCWDLLNT